MVVTGGRSRVFLLRIGERPRRDVGLSERNPGEEVAEDATRQGTRDTVTFLSSLGWWSSGVERRLQKRG